MKEWTLAEMDRMVELHVKPESRLMNKPKEGDRRLRPLQPLNPSNKNSIIFEDEMRPKYQTFKDGEWIDE